MPMGWSHTMLKSNGEFLKIFRELELEAQKKIDKTLLFDHETKTAKYRTKTWSRRPNVNNCQRAHVGTYAIAGDPRSLQNYLGLHAKWKEKECKCDNCFTTCKLNWHQAGSIVIHLLEEQVPC